MTLLLSLCVSAFAGDSWGKPTGAAWEKTGTEVSVGKRLSVSAPVVVGDLALYPVVDRESTGRPESELVPLSTAMATGQVGIHETSDGTVDRLVLVNHGDAPVLLQAGDVVQGGMQDRVIRRSALVAGGGRPVVIPVQCVERGRWHGADGAFRYAGRVDPTLRDIVVRAASQDATWAAVAATNRARGVVDSASYLAGRRVDRAMLLQAEEELRRRFADDKRVVGVVVARGGVFTGSELYSDPALFAQDRLVVLGSHLSAPTRAVAGQAPSVADAAAFLEAELGD